MRRVQLFEFNDLAWVPPAIRDSEVEALSRALRWGGILRGLVAPFRAFLKESGVEEVLDLCAGAGGPAEVLASEFRRARAVPPRFVLTDLFPRHEAWRAVCAADPDALAFHPDPVDATAIPPALSRGRARVIINAFHHFPPEVGRAILEDAMEAGAPLFIAEGFERHPLQFLNIAPAGLVALYANPLLSPEGRARKALVTWLLPVALLASIWDGVVSTLRVYTEEELRAMVAGAGARYRWQYGTYRYPPLGTGTYFHGVPALRAATARARRSSA